jgi:RNA polymerase sigma-70 factor (ECF subfamily)
MQSNERVGRELALRRAVLAGDEFAWRTFYDAEFASLYAYVLWRCGGLRDHADDVVQETWMTAVRRIRQFDPNRGSFAGYLRGIAANVLRNHFRSTRRWKTQQLNGHLAAPEVDDERRHQAERIAHALALLPDHYEYVLRSKYVDGLSVAEIAAASAESPKAVESLLTRARQAFREVYDQDE